MLAMLYCFLFYNIHHTFLNKNKKLNMKNWIRGVSKVCYDQLGKLYPAATNRMRPLNPNPLLTFSKLSFSQRPTRRPLEITPLGSNCFSWGYKRSPENPLRSLSYWPDQIRLTDFVLFIEKNPLDLSVSEFISPQFQMMLQMKL